MMTFCISNFSHWYLNIEMFGKGKVVIAQRVRFVFVSHLKDSLVVILSKCDG